MAIQFVTQNISLPKAIGIVKFHLNDESVCDEQKIIAIEKVVNMETHNSITKDDLINSLKWIYENYDMEGLI